MHILQKVWDLTEQVRSGFYFFGQCMMRSLCGKAVLFSLVAMLANQCLNWWCCLCWRTCAITSLSHKGLNQNRNLLLCFIVKLSHFRKVWMLILVTLAKTQWLTSKKGVCMCFAFAFLQHVCRSNLSHVPSWCFNTWIISDSLFIVDHFKLMAKSTGSPPACCSSA